MLILPLLAGIFSTPAGVQAARSAARSAQASQVTPFDLILAMNSVRASYGHALLVEDPIVMAVAQSTAEIMAANQMSWHIGDVRGRVAAAGYGGGGTVWATENFALGPDMGIDEIMIAWSDPDHMRPAVNGAYCNVGAGTAKAANGMTYYILIAAYSSGKSCGSYTAPGGPGKPGGGEDGGEVSPISQLIVPVKIATPDADGKIYHEVQAGQSFWSIAVAYKVTIKDIEFWNNISRDVKLQVGQRLFIPDKNTEGYATPTPVGMVHVSTPNSDGKIVHIVQPYNTLYTIAEAYKVSVDTIINLNGLQLDWPLQVDQKLLIYPGDITPSPTPRPLTPIEKLTPDSDGNYYHVVQSGQTLSGIASLYEVSLNNLMAWNGLNSASILYPEQKLLLQVTPPATETPTPGPVTPTPTATLAPPTPTPSVTPTRGTVTPAATAESPTSGGGSPLLWFIPLGLAAGGLALVVAFSRRKG